MWHLAEGEGDTLTGQQALALQLPLAGGKEWPRLAWHPTCGDIVLMTTGSRVLAAHISEIATSAQQVCNSVHERCIQVAQPQQPLQSSDLCMRSILSPTIGPVSCAAASFTRFAMLPLYTAVTNSVSRAFCGTILGVHAVVTFLHQRSYNSCTSICLLRHL